MITHVLFQLLITQKRGRAEGATPALAATQGKRFACLQEPEGDETINVGLMKELTGGDTIIARKMYAEPAEFKPQFKMLLTCNILPDIKFMIVVHGVVYAL